MNMIACATEREEMDLQQAELDDWSTGDLTLHIIRLERALQTAARRFDLLAAYDDTERNGVRPSVGYAEAAEALKR